MLTDGLSGGFHRRQRDSLSLEFRLTWMKGALKGGLLHLGDHLFLYKTKDLKKNCSILVTFATSGFTFWVKFGNF